MKSAKVIRTLLLSQMLILMMNPTAIGQNYCYASFLVPDPPIHLDQVVLYDMVNLYTGLSAGCYQFYPDSVMTVPLNIGEEYEITLSGETTIGATGDFAAWIDYDDDKFFSASELIVWDTNLTSSSYKVFTIPNNALYLGPRRMRVMMGNFGAQSIPDPCAQYIWEETEDYTVQITQNAPHPRVYCIPLNPEGYDEFNINEFHLQGIVNNSYGSNYENYIIYPPSMFTTNLMMGSTYPLYIWSISAGIPGGYGIWIDLNDNGYFEAFEHLVSAGPGLGSLSATITIPYDPSYAGMRRMRVRSAISVLPTNPCGLYGGGETEDYTVTITSPPVGSAGPDPELSLPEILPNPASDVVFVSNTNRNGLPIRFVLFDMLGRILIDESVPAERTYQADIQSLGSGLYFYDCFRPGNGSILSGKLVVN